MNSMILLGYIIQVVVIYELETISSRSNQIGIMTTRRLSIIVIVCAVICVKIGNVVALPKHNFSALRAEGGKGGYEIDAGWGA